MWHPNEVPSWRTLYRISRPVSLRRQHATLPGVKKPIKTLAKRTKRLRSAGVCDSSHGVNGGNDMSGKQDKALLERLAGLVGRSRHIEAELVFKIVLGAV